jgi:hypothetical protein
VNVAEVKGLQIIGTECIYQGWYIYISITVSTSFRYGTIVSCRLGQYVHVSVCVCMCMGARVPRTMDRSIDRSWSITVVASHISLTYHPPPPSS